MTTMSKIIRSFSIGLLSVQIIGGHSVYALSQPIIATPDLSAPIRSHIESGRVALPFIKNNGQYSIPEKVKYYVDTFAGTVFVERNRLVYSLPDVGNESSRYIISESFVAPDIRRKVHQVVPSETQVSYFLGKDKSGWTKGVPTAHEISLGNVWNGIEVSLKAYNNTIEKIFTVLPEGSVSDINMSLDGVTSSRINEYGELVLVTPEGELVMSAPIAFQNIDGKKVSRNVVYVVSNNHYGFSVPEYDHRYPLVIDPLIQSTYLGGSGTEEVLGSPLSIDSSGNVYFLGVTASSSYPGVAGGYQSVKSTGNDIVISKLNSSLTTLIQSTYLGGTGDDVATRGYVAFDSSGNAYVLGTSNSTDFPGVAGGYQSVKSTGYDFVISKLNNSLTTLIQSTYVGGVGTEAAYGAVSFDSTGNLFFMGANSGGGFPGTTGGYQTANAGGGGDLVIVKMNSGLTSLAQATYLGGAGLENGFERVAFDASDNVYVTGHSTAAGFPGTTGGAQPAYAGGGSDIIVAKLNNALTSLIQSTYLGGTGVDATYGMVTFDTGGNIYITGETTSTNFPGTTGGYQSAKSGSDDFIITKLNNGLTSIIQSTYLGGTGSDWADGSVRLDSTGNVFIGGKTSSSDFPGTTGGYQSSYAGSGDLVIAKLNSGLTSLTQATYLGGTGLEDTDGTVWLDTAGNVYIGTDTSSTNFPGTTGGYQSANAGGVDFIIAKLTNDLQATKVASVGSSAGNGSYGVGASIPIAVQFNGPVVVTGTPRLTLETGGTDAVVDYTSGSGTSTLIFTYTVGAGHTSADLDYGGTGSLALNGGTITTAVDGFAATLTLPTPGAANSLGANKALVIDTTAPSAPNVSLVTPVTSTTVMTNPVSVAGSGGSVEANSTVTLLENGVPVCTSTAAGDGSFSCLLGQVGGVHSYTITATDSSGNISVPSVYSLMYALSSAGGSSGGGGYLAPFNAMAAPIRTDSVTTSKITVRQVQEWLRKLGYTQIHITGKYNVATIKALRALKKQYSIQTKYPIKKMITDPVVVAKLQDLVLLGVR